MLNIFKKQAIIYSAWEKKTSERENESETETNTEGILLCSNQKGRQIHYYKILLFPLHLHIYVSLVNTATLYCGIWQDGREFVLFSHCLVIFNETQDRFLLRCFVALLLLSA